MTARENRRSPRLEKENHIGGPVPCLKLKELRNRAGLTALTLAKACGQTSPNSFYRYESVDKHGYSPIPDHIIELIMPHMVGRGHPPVTADELLAISSANRLLTIRGKTSSASPNRILPLPMAAPAPAEQQLALPLVVRYRAEHGVYMDDKAVHERTFGLSQIVAAQDIRADQFTVLDADTGAMLHCAAPTAYSPQQLVGKRVVITKGRRDMGLSEIGLARVTAVRGNTYAMEDSKGKAVDGDVCGVVIGSYSRE